MTRNYNRQSIFIGNKIKITKIKSGVDARNVPYWKFYVPFTMLINGNSVVYKHLWCRVIGTLNIKENDWVKITDILGYTSNCRHDDNGGMTIFEDLVVQIEKVEMEKDYGTNTDE